MNILDEANTVVNERQVAYDKAEDNFKRIADLWNGYLKAKGIELELKPQDVAAMNVLQKMAREIWQHKRDNLVDIAGYAQCWHRIEENE